VYVGPGNVRGIQDKRSDVIRALSRLVYRDVRGVLGEGQRVVRCIQDKR
jgi:hypothetical protein